MTPTTDTKGPTVTDKPAPVPDVMRDAMSFATDTFRVNPNAKPGEPLCFTPTLFLDTGDRRVIAPAFIPGREGVEITIEVAILRLRPRRVALLCEGRVTDVVHHEDGTTTPGEPFDVVLAVGVEWGGPCLCSQAKVEGGALAAWCEPFTANGRYAQLIQSALSEAWKGVN